MLSVILPTYNEAGSLPSLIERLGTELAREQIAYEIIVVDDNSPDGTGQIAQDFAPRFPVRVLRRAGKAGLASAVLDGVELGAGDLICVMDADLSHPPEAVPSMVRAIERGEGIDLAVGSRYVAGGAIEDWPLKRTIVSMVANVMTRWLTPVKDATSGFYVIRRSALEGVRLNPIGFKIGLETFTRAHYRGYVEVPYVFTDRKHGLSKFGTPEIKSFLQQLLILYWAKYGWGQRSSLRSSHPASTSSPGVR